MISQQFFANLKSEAARVGYPRAFERSMYSVINKRMCARRLDVIHLRREFLAPLDESKYTNVTSRLATISELLDMQADGRWQMTDELIEGFRVDGDACLLSFVDDKLAGYTWVHTAGRPLLAPGLRIRLGSEYGYNFAGFTLPDFRGYGLAPYRHHQVMNRPEWSDKQGMLGFVESTNWSSKKGQAKSGYQPFGTITLIGGKNSFKAIFSSDLKSAGIRRIDA